MKLLQPKVVALMLALPLAAPAELSERQTRLLANNCLQCHVRADSGAPSLGRAGDWKARNSQGEERLLRNVIEGLRGMPPLGYCAACTEADLRALTRAVAGLEGAK